MNSSPTCWTTSLRSRTRQDTRCTRTIRPAQPFQYYNYTIFVAEVASTFNEQLLSKHLMRNAPRRPERAFLINREIDAIRGTILRQTMFAEFEKITHELAEQNEPLRSNDSRASIASCWKLFRSGLRTRRSYRSNVFRIPHFYHAFYVYKYATGLSAAIALAERVTTGGQRRGRRLPQLPARGLLQRPARPIAQRGGGHGKARTRRHSPGLLPPAGQ